MRMKKKKDNMRGRSKCFIDFWYGPCEQNLAELLCKWDKLTQSTMLNGLEYWPFESKLRISLEKRADRRCVSLINRECTLFELVPPDVRSTDHHEMFVQRAEELIRSDNDDDHCVMVCTCDLNGKEVINCSISKLLVILA